MRARHVEIVLIDDHVILRECLRAVLDRTAGLKVVGEAATAEEAMRVVAESRPHVVLLDLKLTASSHDAGLDLCRRILRRHPRTRVLILTAFSDDRAVVEAVQAGARGYVLKRASTTELVQAIWTVTRGDIALDPPSTAAMMRVLGGAELTQERFTERELEILALVAAGLSNPEIGCRLYIAESTVKFHLGNVMRKLAVNRRAGAVTAAMKLGLLDP